MDENLNKAISYFCLVFIIIIAFSLFFSLYNEKNKLINTVNGSIADRGSVYVIPGNGVTEKENIVSGAFIIACINNGLETDISVDSVIIPKTTEIGEFNFGLVDMAAKYRTEYVYDTSGKVIMVKFKKTGGER